MQRITLVRTTTNKYGTFGQFYGIKSAKIFSLELPWKDNLPWKSCIPSGVYCVVHEARQMRLVGGTVGASQADGLIATRCGILIHPANWVSQLGGCIAPGLQVGELDNQRWTRRSQMAFEELKAATESPFELVIRWIGQEA